MRKEQNRAEGYCGGLWEGQIRMIVRFGASASVVCVARGVGIAVRDLGLMPCCGGN